MRTTPCPACKGKGCACCNLRGTVTGWNDRKVVIAAGNIHKIKVEDVLRRAGA